MNAVESSTASTAASDAPVSTSTEVETSLGPKSGDITGEAGGDDETSAPEEASQSQVPGDPRPPHQLQPPTKEQY